MIYNSRADVGRPVAEWYDNKPKVKLGAFQSQLQASYVSSHTEELWDSLSTDDSLTLSLSLSLSLCIYI